jgi:hypothetical protein
MRLLKIIVLVLVCSVALTGGHIRAADYYPSDTRFGDFEANVRQGIVGGIPSRSGGAVISAATYGFAEAASGATNAAAIMSALAASSEGDVISLPAGEFSVNQVDINRVYPNRTIRGAGMDVTIINGLGTYAFGIGDGANWGNEFNPNSTITTLTKDSATITVLDGSGFPTPSNASQYRIARIQLVNEPDTPVVSPAGYSKVRSFSVLMIARSGNNITLSQPIPSAFADGASGATFELGGQSAWHTYGVGLEDFTIDGNDSGGSMAYAINGTMASQCWLKGVKLIGFNNYGAFVTDWVSCEIREVYIGAGFGGGTNRAGLLWNTCSYGLVENNIMVDVQPAIEVNFGSTANVFGYNFYNDKIANVNHGAHNSYNLYEGDISAFPQSDGYFGGSSEDTFFRNWMRNGVIGSFKRFTRNYNLVANIIGTVGGSYTTDGSEHWGTPNIGNNNYSGGTWELSTSDYSLDWDSAAQRPYIWTGTLTTRTSNTAGIITLDTGMITSFNAALANIASSTRNVSLPNAVGTTQVTVTNVTGNDVTFTVADTSYVLPADETSMWVTPGPISFQEKDLDVENTMIRKANYYVLTSDIPAGESLGSDTLAPSYYRTTKPDWFGTLTWPAFNPSAPPASQAAALVATPAAYRYTNGNSDYLGGGGGAASATIQTLNVGTLNIQ